MLGLANQSVFKGELRIVLCKEHVTFDCCECTSAGDSLSKLKDSPTTSTQYTAKCQEIIARVKTKLWSGACIIYTMDRNRYEAY